MVAGRVDDEKLKRRVRPRGVPKKRNLNQNINYSKSYIWNSFLENSISGIQSFYICPDFPVDIIRDFFKKNSEYLAESLITNKN